MTDLHEVIITKLVHGGQGMGELPDGRKVFVWNALPGETVRVRLSKQKRSYAEAIAEEIIVPSADRIDPAEENYLSTSPWQIMTFEAENAAKHDIVAELFAHEKVALPELKPAMHDDRQWAYRNKMEYSFWGDDDGLHLALHRRGSHGKQIVQGSKLAMPALDAAANAICRQLSERNARAGDLKTIIVRCNQKGDTVAALYTKLETFRELPLPPELHGLRIYYSNPKSPASVPTKLLHEVGDCHLHDDLLERPFTYDVDSLFQVNIPVFEQALQQIKDAVAGTSVTDMYAGVGSIGLSVASKDVQLIELDPATAAMARLNAEASKLRAEVIEASTEKVTEYITGDQPVVFDPPRAGLHDKVVEATLTARPPKIVYLSCNPATQARDLAKLQQDYAITHFQIYNFFPRTPHVEALAILQLRPQEVFTHQTVPDGPI